MNAKILQTVRKLQDLSIEWGKERAGRDFGCFRPVGRLMRPERASGHPHARGWAAPPQAATAAVIASTPRMLRARRKL